MYSHSTNGPHTQVSYRNLYSSKEQTSYRYGAVLLAQPMPDLMQPPPALLHVGILRQPYSNHLKLRLISPPLATFFKNSPGKTLPLCIGEAVVGVLQ